METWNARSELPAISFLEHIKKELLRAAVVFLLAFIAAWIFRNDLAVLVKWPLVSAFTVKAAQDTILLRVIDMFMLHVKICLYVSFLIVIPFMSLSIWLKFRKFLRERARWFVELVPFLGIMLFFFGVAFCYTIVLPFAFKFLAAYSIDDGASFLGNAGNNITTDYLRVSMREHVSLTMGMLLAFGAGFEAPLVMALLSGLGLVDPGIFAKNRGIALVILAVSSSILTPPDPWTMLLLLGPLFLLYESGILAARLVAPGKIRVAKTD